MNKSTCNISLGSKRHPLTLSIRALLLAGVALGTARAQNLITNGDFDANAAAFVGFPGYLGGANPVSIPDWSFIGGGAGINGTDAPGTGSPFAPANNVPHFLFMQGDFSAEQTIAAVNGTLYQFSFDAAARLGNQAGVTVFADNTAPASLVLDGFGTEYGWLSQAGFQRFAFGFTGSGTQTVRFTSSGVGDHTTDLDKVSITAVPGAMPIADGTIFFTEQTETVAYDFALAGSQQVIYQRAGAVTYTGDFATDNSGGTLHIKSFGRQAGTQQLTFGGGTFALQNKEFQVSGQNGGNVDSIADANLGRVTFQDVTLTSTSQIIVTRSALHLAGNSSVAIDGALISGNAWNDFTLGGTSSVTAGGGVDFRNVASHLALNGGTLTTPSIWGNFTFGGASRTIFNGTRVIASAPNADFLKMSHDFDQGAHSAAAEIANGGAIFDTNGHAVTIANDLANLPGQNGGLTKLGNGTLTLANANTFSGATTVAAGTLSLTHDLALQNSALEITGAGAVTLSGTVANFGGLKGGANLASAITGYGSVTALTLNPVAASASNTYSGVIADGAPGMTLTKTGAGTQILTGTNTYTGATTIAAGTLHLQGTSTSVLLTDDFSATGNPNTGDLNFNQANRQTGSAAPQNWSGAGNAQVGNITHVQQPAGTNGDYLLLAAGSATLNDLALSTANSPGPLKVSFDMFRGNSPVNNPTEWTSFTLRSSGGNGFPVAGSGELGFLYRQNTGIQVFNNSTAIGDIAGTIGGDSFGFYLADSAGTGSPFAGNGTKVIVTQGGNVLGSYALDTGMGTSYITFGSAGGMIGGVDNLAVVRASAFQPNVILPTSNVSLTASGATLQLTDVNQTVASLNGVRGTSVKIGLFSRLTVNNSGADAFDGVISGAGDFAKSGAGSLLLRATSTYTGSTIISGGTLRLGGNIAPVSVTVPNAGFENTGSLGGGGWAYAPTGADWSFDGAGISSNNQPWINTAPEGTHAGFIQGTSISQVLNFGSTTTYDFSFLAANRPGYNPNGLLLQIDGITVSTLPAAGFQTDAAFRPYTFAGVTVTSGMHTVAFVANNTFGGDVATAIDAISISAPAGLLPSGTALQITTAGAAFDLDNGDQTVGSLAGVAGASVQNIGAFTVGGDNTSTSFAGTITGGFRPRSFTKVGDGTLTISGGLLYDGPTNANDGTLRFEASQTLSALNIADGAIVELGAPLPPAPDFAEGIAPATLPVPEPGTVSLLLLGALALLRRVRPQPAR